MPALQVGELALTTDTRRVWVGTAAGNEPVSGADTSLGIEADLPALSPGQLYFAIDTASLWVGTEAGNVKASGGSPSPAAVRRMIFANT